MERKIKTIAKAAKVPKQRKSKYDEKLKINGTFEDLLNELAKPIVDLKNKK